MTQTMTAPAPYQVVWDLAQAVVPSRALHLVAALGVADELGDEPTPSSDLAARCGVDAAALRRLLQLLSAHGIFNCEGRLIAHNPASRLLRSDDPQSMRAFARLNSLPVVWDSRRALEEGVSRGACAAALVHRDGFFAALRDDPSQAAVFAEAMAGKAQADIADVLDAYDFSEFSTIADIGGGRGHLLTAILRAAPGARGVLFDLPDVVATVAGTAAERMQVQGGDFFADVLPAADAYLLMEVIHDWPDEQALAILRAVRRGCVDGATVLVLEHIAPDEGVDRFSATLDVLMLTVTGGRERSAAELGELLALAGFSPRRVQPTAGPIAIVEAVARPPAAPSEGAVR
jgi:hypothetical protein